MSNFVEFTWPWNSSTLGESEIRTWCVKKGDVSESAMFLIRTLRRVRKNHDLGTLCAAYQGKPGLWYLTARGFSLISQIKWRSLFLITRKVKFSDMRFVCSFQNVQIHTKQRVIERRSKNRVSITWWKHRASTSCWRNDGACKENLNFEDQSKQVVFTFVEKYILISWFFSHLRS